MANSDYTDKRIGFGFCPMAFLAAGISPLQSTVNITGYTSPIPNGIVIGAAAMIDDEIVVVNSQVGNTLTLGRGCGDTVPAAHDTGAAIWFFDASIARDTTEYAGGETIAVKLLPRLATGAAVPIPSSPPTTIPFSFRFARPYAPGQFKVNGVPWFTTTPMLDESTASFTATWVHRDRVLQQDNLVDHNAASIGPEAGTTYVAKIYNNSDVLVHTATIASGTTWSYDRVSAITHIGGGVGTHDAYAVLYAKRGTYESWQGYRIDFQFEGVAEYDKYYDDVALMLHFNGADGSTVYTDSSPRPKTVTTHGTSPTIATDFFVFGGAALKLTGASGRLHVAHHDDLDLTTGDFTIEFRLRMDSIASSQIILNKGAGTGVFPVQIYFDSSVNKLVFRGFDSTSTLAFTISESGTTSAGVAMAIALERVGSNFYLKKDGAVVGSASFAGTLFSTTSPISIGAYDNGVSSAVARIDELRITKCLSRYGAGTYTLASSQFIDIPSAALNALVNTSVYEYVSPSVIQRAVAYPTGGQAAILSNRTHYKGKRYLSVALTGTSVQDGLFIGIAPSTWDGSNYIGATTDAKSCHVNRVAGLGVYAAGSFSALSGTQCSNGDVAMMAVDFDAGKIWYGRNGTWYASGDPAAGTNPSQTFTPGGRYQFGATENAVATRTFHFNGDSPHAPPSGFTYWDALTS